MCDLQACPGCVLKGKEVLAPALGAVNAAAGRADMLSWAFLPPPFCPVQPWGLQLLGVGAFTRAAWNESSVDPDFADVLGNCQVQTSGRHSKPFPTNPEVGRCSYANVSVPPDGPGNSQSPSFLLL